MKKVSDITERSATRLKITQDILDHAGHLVENCNDWLASHNFNFVESYDNMEIYVIVRVGVVQGEYSLVFGAIPCRYRDNLVAGDWLLRDLNGTLEIADRREDLDAY